MIIGEIHIYGRFLFVKRIRKQRQSITQPTPYDIDVGENRLLWEQRQEYFL